MAASPSMTSPSFSLSKSTREEVEDALARDRLTRTMGGTAKSKHIILYAAPVPIRETVHNASPAFINVASYDISHQTMAPFGFCSGQRVLFQQGPQAGNTATVIGVARGKLVRQIDGDFPREWNHFDRMAEYDVTPVAVKATVPQYPDEKIALGRRDYLTSLLYLAERFHILFGTRVQHVLGSRSGTTGIILGVRGDSLYEYNETYGKVLPLEGTDGNSIRKAHGLKIVGYHLGPVAGEKLQPPRYSFPTATGFSSTSAALYDVRYSTSRNYFGLCGEQVQLTLGPNYKATGIVVGVKDEKLWCLFDYEQGAVPLEMSEGPVRLARPIEPPFHFVEPKGLVLQYPTVFHEIINIDFSSSATAPFGLFFSQRIVYGKHTEVNAFDDPFLEAKSAVMGAGWSTGIVLGVHRHELWVRNDFTHVAEPLAGSCRFDLLSNYRFAVYAWEAGEVVSTWFDPFFHPQELVRATRPEIVIQESEEYVCFPVKGNKIFSFSTAVSVFEALGVSVRFRDRLRKTPRIEPVLVREMTPQGMVERWQLFGKASWCSIVGVYQGEIYAVFDDTDEAVVLTLEDLQSLERISPSSPSFLSGRKIQSPPIDSLVKYVGNTVTDPLAAEKAKDHSRYDEGALMDSSTVRSQLNTVTGLEVHQMKLLFINYKGKTLLQLLQWVLSKYHLHFEEFEDATVAFKQLVVASRLAGSQIVVPTLLQWHRREREIEGEREEKVRRSVELQMRKDWTKLEYLFCEGAMRLGFYDKPAPPSVPISRQNQNSPSKVAALVDRQVLDEGKNPFLPLVYQKVAVAEPYPSIAADKSAVSPAAATSNLPHLVTDIISTDTFAQRTQKKHWAFRYVTFQGETLVFDISKEACAAFGFYHGQRLKITKGDLEGAEVTVIGVYGRKLWRYYDNAEAQPFASSSHSQIQSRYGFITVSNVSDVRRADVFHFPSHQGELLPFEVSEEALKPWGVSFGERYFVTNQSYRAQFFAGKDRISGRGAGEYPLIAIIGLRDNRIWYASDWGGARGFDGHDVIGEMGLQYVYTANVQTVLPNGNPVVAGGDTRPGRKCAPYQSVGGSLCFDLTPEACAPFGIFPGQQIRSQHMAQISTVIGVRNRKMYRLLPGEKIASAFDQTAADFRRVHEVILVKWTSLALSDLSVDSSPWLVSRQQAFRYISMAGDVYLYDTRDDVCRGTFGFSHGDKVMYNKPANYAGKTAVIIGMRQGFLWKVDDGEIAATMFHGCHRFSDLLEEYGLHAVGRVRLKEHIG